MVTKNIAVITFISIIKANTKEVAYSTAAEPIVCDINQIVEISKRAFLPKRRSFENDNLIILQFAADYGLPGLMGIIAAAVMAASMSSLDSALNSLSTISTIDFYKKYFAPEKNDAHYLNVTRLFTLGWAVIIIIPAIMYHLYSEGSILEILTKVGSYFVGAQLGMFALGFFSKHTTEKGLLIGTLVSFITVAVCALFTDIAWPWYCAIGAITCLVFSIALSIAFDGYQEDYNEYTIKGQYKKAK